MRGFLLGVISAVLVGGLLIVPPPAAGVAGFGDVAEGRHFTPAVQWMVDNRITTGTSEACFSPDDPVTRGQTATFLWRMEGEPDAPPHEFEDVVASYQQEPVSWLASKGLAVGATPTTYSPDDTVTRGEFAAMLHRLAGQPAAAMHPFTDITASWQQLPVAWMAEQSITTGTGPTTFSPNDAVTRGQLASFLYRYNHSPAVELEPGNPRCAPPPLVLGFGGDLQILDYQVPRQMLVAITDILSAPDLMFANLETVVGKPGEVGPPPINKRFNFLSPPESLDQMVAAGIDVLGMANNHTWDYGSRGAASTRRLVDDSMLVGTGAGATAEEAYEPIFVEVGGRVIGMVSLTTLPCGWSGSRTAERIGVAWACDRFADKTLESIAAAEAGSDIAVVMLHSGWELTDCPTDGQRELIDEWIAAGADIISISHPHQLQGVEVIDGAAVLWSTGNLAFQNGGFRRARSAVFEVTITDSVEQIRLIPTVLPGAVAAPADPETAERVFAEVSERTVGGRIDENGILVPDSAPSICD